MGIALALAVAAARGSAGSRIQGSSEPFASRSRARFLMGTRLEIILPAAAPEVAFEDAFAEVDRLESVLSNWRQESELSRLNRSADRAPVRCSAVLFDAVETALRFARSTGGAFDPTVEPMVRALGLRSEEGRLPGSDTGSPAPRPASEDDAGTAAPIGWRHVHLNPARRSVRFDAPGVGIDLGGIGKGIALDAAARVLSRHGVKVALLDFGGQVLALGAPPGRTGWPVGVAGPGARDRAALAITLHDLSASTSGNDERSRPTPGGRIGHILDPARRAPATFEGSVTVLARTATAADALSTGLFVMGPERGAAWAEARGEAALFLWTRPDGGLERRATTPFRTLQHNDEPGAVTDDTRESY